MQRRTFIKALGVAAVIPTRAVALSTRPSLRYLRPPGALAEDEFLSRYIRCGQCGEACPNRCISYFGMENGLASLDTPYITPREKACILCMKCGDVCPSGAIQPIARELEPILAGVHMGHAVVDERLCLSY